MSERVRVISILPELLGTYGDSGNAIILKRRIELRGIDVELVNCGPRDKVSSDGDFYLIGGGEDGPQTRAANLLAIESPLAKAIDNGAVVFAVCAGFQILGDTFPGPNGSQSPGLGLFRAETHRFKGPRSVGELLVSPLNTLVDIPVLTGYENHQSVTELSGGTSPLGTVLVGNGNNFTLEYKVDGAVQGNAIGTYMHGPVFARNPEFCDYVISLVLGVLDPIADVELELAHARLYNERVKAVGK